MKKFEYKPEKGRELNMMMTSGGVSLLAKIYGTCFEDNERRDEQEEFVSCSKDGVQEIRDFSEFQKIFPIDPSSCRNLAVLSEELGKDVIDEEAVCLFFGGASHIKDIEKEIKECGLESIGRKISCAVLLAHTLLPVRIEKAKGELRAVYENSDLRIAFEKAVGLDSETGFEDGEMVLCHLGFVFRSHISSNIPNRMLEIQKKDNIFSEASKAVDSIDCEKLRKIFSFMEAQAASK